MKNGILLNSKRLLRVEVRMVLTIPAKHNVANKIVTALVKWFILMVVSVLPFLINCAVGLITKVNVLEKENYVAAEFLLFTVMVSFETIYALYFCEHKGILKTVNFLFSFLSIIIFLFSVGFYFLVTRDNLMGVTSSLQTETLRTNTFPAMVGGSLLCGYSYIVGIFAEG